MSISSPQTPARAFDMQTDSFHNISGYCFVAIPDPELVRDELKVKLQHNGVLGTVLVATEGLNVALVGDSESIAASQLLFTEDARFASIDFKLSLSSFSPFSKLKVKVRPEIITFGQSGIDPQTDTALYLEADELKQWLESGKDFQLLDTRNNYETESGTFEAATTLDIENFRDLPEAVSKALDNGTLDPEKPLVTFCTGGVRCEKAAPWMSKKGFREVYQIRGGILRYFEHCGSEHWNGDCFVFDDRVEITPKLEETGAVICRRCHKAVSRRHQTPPDFVENSHCPACLADSSPPLRGNINE